MKTLPNGLFFEAAAEEIAAGRNVLVRLKGDSMRPLLRGDRDVAELGPFAPEEVARGAVALYFTRGRHVLHRVMRVDGERCVCMGDGNMQPEYISSRDIIALMRSVRRPCGRVTLCSSRRWRWSSWLWMALRPARRYLLFFLYICAKLRGNEDRRQT
jgi:hypothetical protein